MDHNQQPRQPSQQEQGHQNPLHPTTQNTSANQYSSQGQELYFTYGGSASSVANQNQAASHPNSSATTTNYHGGQPPPFASAPEDASEDASQSKNMYAIQTYLEPVAREGNDSPFQQSLNKLFASDRNEDAQQLEAAAVAPTMNEPRANPLSQAGPEVSASRVTKGKQSMSTIKSPPVRAAAGKVKSSSSSKNRRQAKTSTDQLAPFDYLKNMLAERGYSFATIKSTEAGYMTDPSPLQLASFGTKLVNAVHTSDVALLSSLLGCGLSPNPCNQFRDSSLDWACRKANEAVFRCFLDHDADLRVCDGFGRTPLHHAAWADAFSPAIASSILQRDPIQLFLEDSGGRTPLEYVPSKLTTQWTAFLDNRKEELFPINGPPLAVTKRQFSQLPDPSNAISVDLAKLVSSGHAEPEQILAMDELTRKAWKMPK